jgi:hypothetical protein
MTLACRKIVKSKSMSNCDWRSVSMSCCLTVTILFSWGALSDERMGLYFVYVAGPCQRSLFRVRVPWDSWPYFTVSHLRLPFSSPPTIRRVTVEYENSSHHYANFKAKKKRTYKMKTTFEKHLPRWQGHKRPWRICHLCSHNQWNSSSVSP